MGLLVAMGLVGAVEGAVDDWPLAGEWSMEEPRSLLAWLLLRLFQAMNSEKQWEQARDGEARGL